MEHPKRTGILTLIALVVASMLPSPAFAPGREQPSGDPPFGVALQSTAQGTKVTGVALMEFYNQVPDESDPTAPKLIADARITLRLSKANLGPKLIFAEASGIDINDIPGTQAALMAAVQQDVVDEFFDGQAGLTVTLVRMREFVSRGFITDLTSAAFPANPETLLTVADIELAVK